MTKVDIGLLVLTAVVVVTIGTLLALGQQLSVLPEVLIGLAGIIIGKRAEPVVQAFKAKRAAKVEKK